MQYWINIENIYRMFYFVAILVLGAAAAVKILKEKKINYMYIFGIDPVSQLTHVQLCAVSLLMMVLINICMLLQILIFKFDWLPPNHVL